mmetsp:Transcript_9466/g.14629  ORF Transcript_9466/g.14629 Transcript_9466/m.14629 type:complete len:462 (+) Transcript_9466:848-2233(+)
MSMSHSSSFLLQCNIFLHDPLLHNPQVVGPLWVTSQRLRMTSFSLPVVYDKTYLVIPKPTVKNTIAEEARRVVAPFTPGLWLLLLGEISVTAWLSVWFTDPHINKVQTSSRRRTRRKGRLFKYYGRMAIDQCLRKGIFFCSGGVEQDKKSSLPTKMLLFGFGFFILIAVSAYVANLAAFLTMSRQAETINTIDGAIRAGYRICAHPALQEEISSAFPKGDFYFHQDDNEFKGVLDDYNAGKCKALAIGFEDTSMDPNFLERMCENKIVFTDSVIVEIPVALPLREGIANGFNYWQFEAQKKGADLQASKEKFQSSVSCDVFLFKEEVEGNEMDAITVNNFFLPIVFFGTFAVVSVALQIRHIRTVKKGRKSLMGSASHTSAFNPMETMKKSMAQKKNYDDDSAIDFEDYRTTLPRDVVLDSDFEDYSSPLPTVRFAPISSEEIYSDEVGTDDGDVPQEFFA